MEPIQAERLVKMNHDRLDPNRYDELKERLVYMDYNEAAYLFTKLRTPTTATILSVVLGGWAIDRFYIGDWILGFLKILTCGGCWIWWIADWFLIGNATRSNNTKMILSHLPEVSETAFEEVQNASED